MKRLLLGLLAGALLAGSLAWAQGTAFTTNHFAPTVTNAYDLGATGYVWRTVYTNGISLGASGTALTQMRVYAASITPAASSAAIQTAEQTFTVTGLATTDIVYINGPAPTSLCPPTTVRVSATNTLAIGFTTLTAAACTPAAGTYNIVAIRS